MSAKPRIGDLGDRLEVLNRELRTMKNRLEKCEGNHLREVETVVEVARKREKEYEREIRNLEIDNMWKSVFENAVWDSAGDNPDDEPTDRDIRLAYEKANVFENEAKDINRMEPDGEAGIRRLYEETIASGKVLLRFG